MIDHWTLIIASYALTVAGTLGLTLWSYAAMRRAEAEAEAVGRER